MQIFRWFARFTPRRYRRGNPHNYRRARFIVSLAGLGFAGALALALIFCGPLPFPAGAGLCLLGALMYGAILPILQATSLDVAGHFLVLTFFCLTGCINFAIGGWSGPLLIWYAFLPAMAALVTSARWAIFWAVMVVAQMAGLHWLHVHGLDRPRLSNEQIETLSFLSILGFLCALLILTFLYEKFESQIIRRLQKNNRELALARDEALAASYAKTTFLANMSHEFRTPLNAIIGYSDMLLDDEALELAPQKDLTRIRDAGNHLLKLVNGLLDLSKAEAGKMDLEITSVPLRKLLEEVEDTVRPMLSQQNNQLHLELPEEPVVLQTDVLKLKQCLINLLGNATKFTQDGRISLRASRPDKIRLLLEIEDTGIGISQEQLKTIFVPFTQADPSTTRKYGGTGLGLTLAQRFARLLGGDISVESVMGQGSVFRLTTRIYHPIPNEKGV